jgi:hypothetical protein
LRYLTYIKGEIYDHIYFIVVAKDTFYTDPLQTWKDALKYCVYNQTHSFLSSISDFRNKNKKSDVSQGQFWTSTVRGLKFYNMKGDITTAEDELKEGRDHSFLFFFSREWGGGWRDDKNQNSKLRCYRETVICRD